MSGDTVTMCLMSPGTTRRVKKYWLHTVMANNSTYPQSDPEARSGYPGNLTEEQSRILAEFRELLKAEGFTERLDDATLLRFLRARKFNLEASKLMFTESEKWRKEFGTDELLDSFKYDEKPLVSAYYPQYYHKTDIDGRPVYIEQFGKIVS